MLERSSYYGIKRFLGDPSVKAVSDEIAEARMLACETCPLYDKELEACTMCGCHMPAKTLREDASCPANKW